MILVMQQQQLLQQPPKPPCLRLGSESQTCAMYGNALSLICFGCYRQNDNNLTLTLLQAPLQLQLQLCIYLARTACVWNEFMMLPLPTHRADAACLPAPLAVSQALDMCVKLMRPEERCIIKATSRWDSRELLTSVQSSAAGAASTPPAASGAGGAAAGVAAGVGAAGGGAGGARKGKGPWIEYTVQLKDARLVALPRRSLPGPERVQQGLWKKARGNILYSRGMFDDAARCFRKGV